MRLIVADHLDAMAIAAPSAPHPLDLLGQELFLLDRELAADRVVMERPGSPGRGHIEAGQIAACPAAVADRSHVSPYPGPVPEPCELS